MANRIEKVTLDLEDRFTAGVARAAAATQLLDKSLNSLSGTSVQSSRATAAVDRDVAKMGKTAGGSSREVDRLSGRLRLLADVAAILGPGLVPIAAVGIPAVTGLASVMGGAALAGGGLIIAVQGVGDALKALNKAALEPSAENLQAARIAMEQLSPAGRDLAHQIRALADEWRGIRDASSEAVLPGLSRGIDELESRADDLERIFTTIGEATGKAFADGGKSLASGRWTDFFNFLESDVPAIVSSTMASLGNLTHGFSELWMATDPLNDGFLRWLEDATARFDEWSSKLSETRGFQEFVEYVEQTGPQVGETLGSIALAMVRILEAAAPLGGPILQVLEGVGDAISAIADSGAGPAIMGTVTALALLSRGMKAFDAVSTSTWAKDAKGVNGAMAAYSARKTAVVRLSGAMGGLGIAASGVADGFGLANTASMGMMGMIAGPWGAAVGAGVGLMLDYADSQKVASVDTSGLTATLDQQTGAITHNSRTWAANALEKAGVLRTAQELGLSLDTVTDAALGQADALAQVDAATKAAYESGTTYTDSAVGTNVRVSDLATSALALRDAVGVTSTELGKNQAALRRTADAAGAASDGYSRAEAANAAFARQVARTNRLLSDRASWRDYQQSIDDATKSIKENGRNLDTNTQKGRDNEAALDDIAATAVKYAESLKRADRGKFLANAREAFVDAAKKAGMGEQKARDLARELLSLDKKKAEPKITADTSQARNAMDEVARGLRALDGQSATTHVWTIRHPAKETQGGVGQLAPADANAGDRAALAGQIGGVFAGGLTGGGLAGLSKTLTGDIANRQAMDAALAQLAAMGLDTSGPLGGLYAELAASGDVKTARELASGGPGLVDQYEQMFAQRAQLNAQSGAGLAAQIKPVDMQRVAEEQAGYLQDIYTLLEDVKGAAKDDWKDAKDKRNKQLDATKKGPKEFADELKSITGRVGQKAGAGK